ncbi:MAG: DUF5670 family protein [Candidatus Rokuibacteriota bacterium]
MPHWPLAIPPDPSGESSGRRLALRLGAVKGVTCARRVAPDWGGLTPLRERTPHPTLKHRCKVAKWRASGLASTLLVHGPREDARLWTIAAILVVLWALGMFTAYAPGRLTAHTLRRGGVSTSTTP